MGDHQVKTVSVATDPKMPSCCPSEWVGTYASATFSPFSKTKDCFWWTVFRPQLKTINSPAATHPLQNSFCAFSELCQNNPWDLVHTRTIRNEHQLTNSSPFFLLSSRRRPSFAYKTPWAEDSHVHPSWPPVQCSSGSVDWSLFRCPTPQFPEGLPAA